MEEEWNTLLDLAKLQAKPEPAIDVSLARPPHLIAGRKGAYRKLQDDLAAKEQTAKTASAGGGGAADKWREDGVGVCAFSQYGCESCGTCFVSSTCSTATASAASRAPESSCARPAFPATRAWWSRLSDGTSGRRS